MMEKTAQPPRRRGIVIFVTLLGAFLVATELRADVVFVTTPNNISKVTSNGVVSVFVVGDGSAGNNINDPIGLTSDSNGNLYADSRNNFYAVKVTPAAVVSNYGYFPGFSGQNDGIAMDASNTLFVAQRIQGQIAVQTAGGATSVLATGLYRPNSLAVDSNGNVYSADEDNTISKITPGGVVSTYATGFTAPAGLAFDTLGNLYVADYSIGTVSRVDISGAVSTYASGLNGPRGLAFGSAGDLYVAGGNDGTVSRITPDGVVHSFATGLNSPVDLVVQAAPEPSVVFVSLVVLGGLTRIRARKRS